MSITCTTDNFVLLAVPGLSSIPAAVCLQHRDQRISEIISENWDYYQNQSRSEVTSMHAGNRCWQILTSRPQETVNQHTIFSDEMCKEDPTQGIPDWLRTFLWKRDLRSGRWCFKSGGTAFILTSANSERDLFHEQKRLVTWQQWSAKVNLGTLINSSLSWYKISTLSGYYPCETKTSQETEKNFTKVFRAVTEAKSYLYGRFIRIWKVVWRIIMESSNNYTLSLRNKRNCRTSCTSSKRRDISRINAIWVEWKVVVRFHEMVLLSAECPRLPGRREISKWTKFWWIIQRTSYIIWRIGWISHKTPRERQSTNSSICKAIITKNLSRICFDRGWIWEEKKLTADIEELEKLDASETYPRRLNAKEVLITQRDEQCVSPMADGSAKLSGRNFEFQEPTLRRESTVRRESQRRISWR